MAITILLCILDQISLQLWNEQQQHLKSFVFARWRNPAEVSDFCF